MTISLSNNSNPIKLGSIVVNAKKANLINGQLIINNYQTLDSDIINAISLNSVQNLFDNKWRNTSYYTCCDSIDGGIYTGNEINGGEA
jgi:hypothetical protein